jgi:hypothetical protein
MQFETKNCEFSKCATSNPSYTRTNVEREQRDRNHQQLPPNEDDRTPESTRASRTSQPDSTRSAPWASEPMAHRPASRAIEPDPSPMRSNKSPPPHEAACSIVTTMSMPQRPIAALEWRKGPARCAPSAIDRGKQAHLTQPAAPDDLNAMVQHLAADYASATSWTEFVENFWGQQGDFHPQVRHIPHATAALLDDLCVTGARVHLSTPRWTMAQKEAALERGPHQSAKAHTTFLRSEFADMIRKKQWILLPAALVVTQEELRLSPLGVLPQRDRRPRSIIDYTFFRINDETVVMAPPEAM